MDRRRVTLADAGCDTINLVQFDYGRSLCLLMEHLDYDALRACAVRDDDVILCTFPRAGTHWVWEMMRMIINGKHDDNDSTEKESSMFEYQPPDQLDSLPSPRLLNSHLWFEHFPAQVATKKPKLVLVYRNPKDLAVSLYNLHRNGPWYEYSGEFSNWLPLFMEGKVDWGCYGQYLRQWERVVDQHPDIPLHVVKYEHIKQNPLEELDRLSRFLGQDRDVTFLQNVYDACTIDLMRDRKAEQYKDIPAGANFIYRKGQSTWKDWFTVAMSEEFDRYWERAMAGSKMWCDVTMDRRQVKVEDAGGDAISLVHFDFGRSICTPMGHIDFDAIRACPVRDDDVILCAYPRAGTHWVWEMMRMIVNGKLDNEPTEKESSMLEYQPRDQLDSLPSPRLLNSHLWFDHFPAQVATKKPKLVLVYRNPKDLAVSLYNLHRNGPWYEYSGGFKNWLPLFMEGKVDWGCYGQYLRQWERVMDQHPDIPLHVVKYEHIKQNPIEELARLSRFLGQDRDVTFLQNVYDACTIDLMRDRKAEQYKDIPAGASFIYRKGQSTWKDWFTVAMSEEFDRYWERAIAGSKMYSF